MQQAACFYRRSLGDTVVTTLSDGYLDGSTEIVQGISADRKSQIMQGTFRDKGPLRLSLNAFAVQRAGRVALVDTGGAQMNPGTGKVPARLREAGYAPGDIDTVLVSHLHPDHILGLMDTDGKAAYPNARIYLHAAEHAHWHSDAAKAATPEPFQMFYDMARGACAAYAGRVETFTGGEVFPGVTAVHLPGHTPGHSGYQVNDTETLLIWGDIFHIPELQVRHPEAVIVFDVDPQLAAQTRQATLERAATERLLVAGMHLGFPAFSYVFKDDRGFAMVPEVWRDQP